MPEKRALLTTAIKITVTIAILTGLGTACTIPMEQTPTPRPTYTPYPTYTPTGPGSVPAPAISPDMVQEAGDKQWFSGNTMQQAQNAKQAFDEGKYQDALEGFLEAQHLYGKPSSVLQNRIAISYQFLGQHHHAIQHFTNALDIENNAVNRVNRGNLYTETSQCSLAVEDAKAALAFEPTTGGKLHTDVEANKILAQCYLRGGKYLAALQHADAAYIIATDHNYPAEDIDAINNYREPIQQVLDGTIWPEDLILDPAAVATFERGIELYDKGQYAESIIKFEEVQRQHSIASGNIQTNIAHAFTALGQHETAIQHYTAAVQIRDDAHHRVLRGTAYSENGRCEKAKADAEAALKMKTYAEQGYHTGAQAHWILGFCLIEQANHRDALPHISEALNTAQVNGYSTDHLAVISQTQDETRRVLESDIIALTDLQNAKWLQYHQPDTAQKLAELPWVRDGMDTEEEEKILDHLLQILVSNSTQELLTLDPAADPAAPTASILNMPFIQSIGRGDAQAIESLKNIAIDDTTKLKTILDHQTFSAGITDEWTPIIATLWGVQRNNPSLIPVLLDPRETSIESRTITLPLTGMVDLHLIRLGTGGNRETMDALEEAVKNAEFFMHLPLPVRMVSILFADSITPSYIGNNFGSGIAVKPEHEKDQENLPQTLAHEVAHYYWSGNQNWIDEGMSNVMETYHRWLTNGVTMTPNEYPCPHATNIQLLERMNPSTHEGAFKCNYSLGERLFLDLWDNMGDVPFREAAQRLYQMRSDENRTSIANVKSAFNNSPTADRWYSNPTPRRGRTTAEPPPTWRLDEINGTVTEIGIALSKDGPPITSFSSRSHTGPAYLYLRYDHPKFAEESWTANITMTEVFEDGFIYGTTLWQLKIKGIHMGGIWRLPTGPRPGERWKPGLHRAMLHDPSGDKIAEAAWQVTP